MLAGALTFCSGDRGASRAVPETLSVPGVGQLGVRVAPTTPSILPGHPSTLRGTLTSALADTLAGSLPAAGPAFIMPQPFKMDVSITPVLPAGIRN